MKKILLNYYSRNNLGDDLFIKIFTEYFNDCLIYLIVNPRYTLKNMGGECQSSSIFAFIYSHWKNNESVWIPK